MAANEESLLNDLDILLKKSFKDPIVFEQKGIGLVGKYLYITSYDDEKIGLFIGYILGNDNTLIKACVTFIFPHPSSSMSLYEEDSVGSRRYFYKILIRSNLKLKANPYRIIHGKKLPAIIRTLFFKDENSYNIDNSLRFFAESIGVLKHYQPIYKVLV